MEDDKILRVVEAKKLGGTPGSQQHHTMETGKALELMTFFIDFQGVCQVDIRSKEFVVPHQLVWTSCSTCAILRTNLKKRNFDETF